MATIKSDELMKKYSFNKTELDNVVDKMPAGKIGKMSLSGTTYAVNEEAFDNAYNEMTAEKVARYNASLEKRRKAGRDNQKKRKNGKAAPKATTKK